MTSRTKSFSRTISKIVPTPVEPINAPTCSLLGPKVSARAHPPGTTFGQTAPIDPRFRVSSLARREPEPNRVDERGWPTLGAALHRKVQYVLVTIITDDVVRGDWKGELAEAVADPFVPVARSNQSAGTSPWKWNLHHVTRASPDVPYSSTP